MRGPLGKIRPTRRPLGPPPTRPFGGPAPAGPQPMHVEVTPDAAARAVVWRIEAGGFQLRAALTAAEARAMAARFWEAAEAIDPTPEPADDAAIEYLAPQPLSPELEELLADAIARTREFHEQADPAGDVDRPADAAPAPGPAA
jgi:hypothetical protein